MIEVVAAALTGYLLGAIPSGVIVARLWGGHRLLQRGSGHTGGTNVARVTGSIWAGLVAGIFDVIWAALAVLVADRLFVGPWAPAIAGAAAVIGHNWSIYIRGRGGVGLSSILGLLLAWSPVNGLLLAALFVLVWLGLRRVTRHDARATLLALPVLPLAALISLGPSPMVGGLTLGVAAGMVRSFLDWRREYAQGEGFLSQVGVE